MSQFKTAFRAPSSKSAKERHRKFTKEQGDNLLKYAVDFVKNHLTFEHGSKQRALANEIVLQAEKVLGIMKRALGTKEKTVPIRIRNGVILKTPKTPRATATRTVAASLSTFGLLLLLLVFLFGYYHYYRDEYFYLAFHALMRWMRSLLVSEFPCWLQTLSD